MADRTGFKSKASSVFRLFLATKSLHLHQGYFNRPPLLIELLLQGQLLLTCFMSRVCWRTNQSFVKLILNIRFISELNYVRRFGKYNAPFLVPELVFLFIMNILKMGGNQSGFNKSKIMLKR